MIPNGTEGKVILVEHNGGIDGWDAKSKDVATFDSLEQAVEAIRRNGYTVHWDGRTIRDDEVKGAYSGRTVSFYHHEVKKRHTMGAISYYVKGLRPPLPHNSFPGEGANTGVYGRCPHCGAPGIQRERRPNGNDTCANGHVYPSSAAVKP